MYTLTKERNCLNKLKQSGLDIIKTAMKYHSQKKLVNSTELQLEDSLLFMEYKFAWEQMKNHKILYPQKIGHNDNKRTQSIIQTYFEASSLSVMDILVNFVTNLKATN